jgi:hypothetical protein
LILPLTYPYGFSAFTIYLYYFNKATPCLIITDAATITQIFGILLLTGPTLAAIIFVMEPLQKNIKTYKLR